MSDHTAVSLDIPQTAQDLRAQVNRIQEVMAAVMKNGTHYGTIPGCGDKPCLLKPGAEKLMMTFHLAVDPQVLDLSLPHLCHYRVIARITSIGTRVFLGNGIGECSSAEDKYAWKKATCEQEWIEADPSNRREKWVRGRDGPYQIKQIRTNYADVSNTVLKMAKKRALIDGVLTVTAASDIFTQDIEELEDMSETVSTQPTPLLKDKLKTQVEEGSRKEQQGPGAVPASPAFVDRGPDIEMVKQEYDGRLAAAQTVKDATIVMNEVLDSDLPTDWKQGFTLRFKERMAVLQKKK